MRLVLSLVGQRPLPALADSGAEPCKARFQKKNLKNHKL